MSDSLLGNELLRIMALVYNACVAINADNPKQVAENLERLVKAAQQVSIATGGEGDFYDAHDELAELESALNAMKSQ